MIRKPTLLDLSLLIMMAAIWSSVFPAIRVVVADIGPLWVAASRVFLGFLTLLPWTLWRGIILPRGRRQWALVITLTLLNAVVPFFLVSTAGLYISAGMIALLMGTGPFFALVLSHLTTDDERINIYKALAVVLGFSGVALILGPAATANTEGMIIGQLCVLAATLCYAISGVLIRRIEGLPSTRLSTLVLALSSLCLLPIAAATSGVPDVSALSPKILWTVLYLGLLPTGLGYLVRYYLVNTVGYGFFSLGLNLIPVFGVLLGALLLGEAISLTVIAALALVLAGLAVARLGARTAARSAPID